MARVLRRPCAHHDRQGNNGFRSIQSHASPSKAFSFSTLQSPASNRKWNVDHIDRYHKAWQLAVFLVLLPFLLPCPWNRKGAFFKVCT